MNRGGLWASFILVAFGVVCVGTACSEQIAEKKMQGALAVLPAHLVAAR